MDTFEIVMLAIIQGLTEFLPISSSAHLILPSALLGWHDQGLAFDVAVHVGSLIAVIGYFRRDVIKLTGCWLGSFSGRGVTAESQLGWYLILATIPAGLSGLIFDGFIENNLRSIAVIAATTIFFGVLLGWADTKGARDKPLDRMSWKSALLIGLAQALALIPGTSRSGITMTAALALGFDRQAAARFSFLMAIPVITLSGGYKAMQLGQLDQVPWVDITMGAALSGVAAYLCIHYFLALINRIGMMPFVIYRLLLGAALIGVMVW